MERPTLFSRSRTVTGFSLIEVIVATAVFVFGVVGLASLFLLAVATTSSARIKTQATVLALEKMEELRSVAWSALGPSPGGALARDVEGFCDVPSAGFVRRWSLTPLPAAPADAVVIQVVVAPRKEGARGEAHLVGVKSRKGDP